MLDGLWSALAISLAVAAVALLITAVVARRRSWIVDLAGSLLAAVAVASVVQRVVIDVWPSLGDFAGVTDSHSGFPPERLALAVTVVLVSGPHLIRPARRLGRWLVGAATFSVIALGSTSLTGALTALLVATLSTSAVHLILGSTHARADLDDVAAALRTLGVDASSLTFAPVQSPGRLAVRGVHHDGTELIVKVYGRDAPDAAAFAALSRAVWFRGPADLVSMSRIGQVEREALLTFVARDAGITTHAVIAAGVDDDGDAVLVLSSPGTLLSDDNSGWSTEVVVDLWRALTALHDRGVEHRHIDDRHIFVTPDRSGVGLSDLHGARMGHPAELGETDEAQAIVTTALAIGADAAVEHGLAALGAKRLDEVSPAVQPAVLTRYQRAQVKAANLDLEHLRQLIADATGGERTKLRKLQRVSSRTVLQLVLLVVAFSALSSALGGVDFGLLATAVRHSVWWLLLLGFVLAQMARLPAAVSTGGASPRPLALGPLYALQLALAYIGLAIPGSAARFAVNVRFLQRQGLAPGSAIAVSALDSVWWFVVQIAIVLGILLATPLSLDVDLGASGSGSIGRIAIIVAGFALISLALVAAVPTWRRPALEWVRQLLGEARLAAEGLASVRRLGMLIGGNLGLQLLLALALGAIARALGFPIGVIELLLINVSVSLLAGILPIPGGIGVVEGGLTIGLIRAGLPDESALAIALLYRFATFYLPPIWGFFALRWLERRQLL